MKDSEILYMGSYPSKEKYRNIYPCAEDAQQALAKCMVLQLAYHYNKCHQHEIKGDCYKLYHDDGDLRTIKNEGVQLNDVVKFIRKEDLQKCIADNEALFNTMLGVRD